MGNKLFKAIAFATGAAVTYIVASVIANKIVKSEIDDEFIDDIGEAGEEVDKTDFIESTKTRFSIGLITLSIGAGIVAIGGGLIASSYIKLPE